MSRGLPLPLFFLSSLSSFLRFSRPAKCRISPDVRQSPAFYPALLFFLADISLATRRIPLPIHSLKCVSASLVESPLLTIEEVPLFSPFSEEASFPREF